MILKSDLKGFQENFETFFRIPPAVSGPDGRNTAHSQNQSDCRICRILPAHKLRKNKLPYCSANLAYSEKDILFLDLISVENFSTMIR